jgi:Ca2+/Na+ antiporter
MMFSDLNLTQDVAGATFMAIATSSPELFVNIIGTFITESDLGVGTVVGSAVFNTLGVASCIGLAACKVRSLDSNINMKFHSSIMKSNFNNLFFFCILL